MVQAIADAMRTEYKNLADNGLLVQVMTARAAVTTTARGTAQELQG